MNEMALLLLAVAKNWHIPWVRLRESGLLRLLEAGQQLVKTCREDGGYAKEMAKSTIAALGEQGEPFDSLDEWDSALAEMKEKLSR